MRLALLISMAACREHKNTQKNTSMLTDWRRKYQQKLSSYIARARLSFYRAQFKTTERERERATICT